MIHMVHCYIIIGINNPCFLFWLCWDVIPYSAPRQHWRTISPVKLQELVLCGKCHNVATCDVTTQLCYVIALMDTQECLMTERGDRPLVRFSVTHQGHGSLPASHSCMGLVWLDRVVWCRNVFNTCISKDFLQITLDQTWNGHFNSNVLFLWTSSLMFTRSIYSSSTLSFREQQATVLGSYYNIHLCQTTDVDYLSWMGRHVCATFQIWQTLPAS